MAADLYGSPSKKGKANLEVMQEKRQAALRKSLSTQTNPLIIDFFEAIVNLIQLFCKIGGQGIENNLYKEMAHELDHLEREEVLLNAFMVPNDRLKLAVVNALYFVSLC